MKLDQQQFCELNKLAIDRCENAVQSVTQLMEGPQAYVVVVSTACALIRGAADMLRPADHAEDHVLGDVLDGLGVKWKRFSSRTRSAKK